MLLRVPMYYKEFRCIADKCQDSCCIGWEIDIDEDTFDYYKSVEGEFGTRLRTHMVSEDVNSFVLEKNGWCPFLNEKKLCDICIHLGEDALSEVCTEYPRYTLEYGNVKEKALSLSCEEVGRIVFSSAEKITFEETEIEENLEEYDAEWEAELEEFREHLESHRNQAIAILQDRTKSLRDRVEEYLLFCGKVQGIFIENVDNTAKDSAGKRKQFFKDRMMAYEELEVLDSEWTTQKEKLYAFFERHNYAEYYQKFCEVMEERIYEYEHLLVYFTYRYFMKAWYDGNLFAKAQFAVVSYLMIRDMDVVRFCENEEKFSLADRIDTVRIYSKEVEHSEENLELLEEAFSFDEVFRLEQLLQQI